eukprot:1178702-Prorocentrum_minimum.AAC.3
MVLRVITEVEPVVRRLALEALAQCLAEHAVLVPDAVAPSWEVQGRLGTPHRGQRSQYGSELEAS